MLVCGNDKISRRVKKKKVRNDRIARTDHAWRTVWCRGAFMVQLDSRELHVQSSFKTLIFLPVPSTSLSLTLMSIWLPRLNFYAHLCGVLDDVPSSSIASWYLSCLSPRVVNWVLLSGRHLVLSTWNHGLFPPHAHSMITYEFQKGDLKCSRVYGTFSLRNMEKYSDFVPNFFCITIIFI